MKNLSLVIGVILLLFACNKEEFNPNSDIIISDGTDRSIVESSVSGIVVNEFDVAVEGAVVTYEGYSTTTNAFGVFYLQQILMNENGSYIVADKEGFFPGSTTCFPRSNVKSNVRIKIIQKCANGQVNTGQGGTVNVNGDARVILPENYIDENGNPYEGVVTVSAHWIDPFHHDLGDIMPGELRGINQAGVQQALISYGMMAVELEGENGQLLQLAAGETATLKFPLSNNALASAPNSIPLWYFNENTGLWEEEGSAVLENGYYVGEVSHFSFWNCDVPADFVELVGLVTDENNVPLPNVEIVITTQGMGCGYGYTDNHGYFSGFVPAGLVLTIQVKVPECGVAYEADYGPYDTDTSIDQIIVPPLNINSATITGRVLDCDGNVFENGQVILSNGVGNAVTTTNADGTFAQVITYCNEAEITVAAYNGDDPTLTSSTSINTSETTDAGDMLLCQVYQGVMVVNGSDLNGDPINETISPAYATSGDNQIFGLLIFPPSIVEILAWEGSGEGTFPVTQLNSSNEPWAEMVFEIGVEVTITSVDLIDGGEIIGTFTDLNGGALLSGSFTAIYQP